MRHHWQYLSYVVHTPMRACEWCGKRQVRTFGTDGNGRVIEHPLPCGCAELVEARRCVRCRRPSGLYVGTCKDCFVKQLVGAPFDSRDDDYRPPTTKKGGDMDEWPSGLRVQQCPRTEGEQ